MSTTASQKSKMPTKMSFYVQNNNLQPEDCHRGVKKPDEFNLYYLKMT